MTKKLVKLLQHPLDLQQKEPEQHPQTGILWNIILCDFHKICFKSQCSIERTQKGNSGQEKKGTFSEVISKIEI